MLSAFVPGFLLGLSLIVAIGAQNAFVLRQALRREHVLLVILTCALSDAILVSVGVGGFSQLSEIAPWFGTAMRYGGAAFLLLYGALAFRSALRGGATLETTGATAGGGWKAFGTCLALTWLNPHVYLDTVVLLGTIASRYGEMKFYFGLGAVVASFVFFFTLGYGARLLAPLFRKPRSWQILDLLIGVIMWSIAVKLLFFT